MNSTEEDERLVRRALDGDEAALRALIALLTPTVQYRVASVVMRMRVGKAADPRQEVQDLVQEVFLRLFQSGGLLLKTWSPEKGAGLRPFIGLVAQRQAISALRGKAQQAVRLSDDLDAMADELPSSSSAPDRVAIDREQLAQLLDLLRARLSPFGLELFHRIFVDEEPVEDICASTAMTPNAIYVWRSRLTKLTRSLRQELEGTAAVVAGAPPVPLTALSREESQ